jgi:hypothetical protein
VNPDVAELIAALRAGTMSLEEVARRFRQRSWPDQAKAEPKTDLEFATRALEDPDPYVEGSFDDVAAAFHRGDLTLAEYEVLARAASESMDAEDRRRSGGGSAT